MDFSFPVLISRKVVSNAIDEARYPSVHCFQSNKLHQHQTMAHCGLRFSIVIQMSCHGSINIECENRFPIQIHRFGFFIQCHKSLMIRLEGSSKQCQIYSNIHSFFRNILRFVAMIMFIVFHFHLSRVIVGAV